MPSISPSAPRFNELNGGAPQSATQPKYTFIDDFKFSYASGDFVNTGAISLCDGLSAWKQMVYKIAMTPRGRKMAYNSNFGIDYDAILAAVGRKETEAMIAGELARSISALSGTSKVGDFAFSWRGSDLMVTFSVTPKEGAPAEFHFQWVA